MENIAGQTAIIASDVGEFFAPTQYGAIDMLLSEHGKMRERIEKLAELMQTEVGGAVPFFLDGEARRYRGGSISATDLFQPEPAIKALDAHFWRRALDLSGVRDLLPQDKRDGWDKDIEYHKTPPFAEEWVNPTIRDLLDGRERFFLEKVDGIFQALSRSHVTNRPEGFGMRFIFEYALSPGFRSSVCYPNDRFRGYIHDLRMVIGKFMGHPDPEWGATYNALCGVGRDGQWQSLDGGTIRIRGYKKGTAHVEIHPDMAWRLNAVLAKLYPRAIPSQFREPPKKRHREWAPIERVLPDKVRHELSILNPSGKDGRFVWVREIEDKHLRAHVVDVLRSIGMDRDGNFAYDVRPALDHLIRVGTMPDETTHQYYPTPDEMARELVAALDIQPGDECLEPSAGRGAIAAHLPTGRTTCVELAELNAVILESMGLAVERGDFLAWAKACRGKFDAIAMNPPYSQGRAEIHVQAAAGLLARGGRLGAILPANLAGRELVNGAASHEWSEPMSFDGVSIKVCRYVVRMPA